MQTPEDRAPAQALLTPAKLCKRKKKEKGKGEVVTERCPDTGQNMYNAASVRHERWENVCRGQILPTMGYHYSGPSRSRRGTVVGFLGRVALTKIVSQIICFGVIWNV